VHLQRVAGHPLGHGDHRIPWADEAQVQEGIIPQRRRGAPVSHCGLGELGGWVGEEAQGWQSVEALNHSAYGRRQDVGGQLAGLQAQQLGGWGLPVEGVAELLLGEEHPRGLLASGTGHDELDSPQRMTGVDVLPEGEDAKAAICWSTMLEGGADAGCLPSSLDITSKAHRYMNTSRGTYKAGKAREGG